MAADVQGPCGVNDVSLVFSQCRLFGCKGRQGTRRPPLWRDTGLTWLVELKAQRRADGPNEVVITLGHRLPKEERNLRDVGLVSMVYELLDQQRMHARVAIGNEARGVHVIAVS